MAVSHDMMKKLVETDEVEKLAAADPKDWRNTPTEMLARASRFGSAKVARWLIESKGATPTGYCLQRAFERADFDLLFYLVAHPPAGEPADSKWLPDLQWAFSRIDDNHLMGKRPASAYEGVDVARWEAAFGAKLPEPDAPDGAPIEMLARLMASLCTRFGHRLTPWNIFELSHRLAPRSVYYVLGRVGATAGEMPLEYAGKLYRSGLDPAAPEIAALSPRFSAPMTSELATRILGWEGKVPDSVFDHMKRRGQAFDEHCPFLHTVRDLAGVMAVLDVPVGPWKKWLSQAVCARSLIHVQQFIGYRAPQYIEQTSDEEAQRMFIDCMHRFHFGIASTLLKAFPVLNRPRWINWVEDIIRAIQVRHAGYLRKDLEKDHPEFLPLFDFEAPMPARVEIWRWWEIDPTGGSTYRRREGRPKVTVDPRFESIKTLADIKANLERLNREVVSPTDCYFEVREGGGEDDENAPDAGEIFYVDSQGCLNWAVEASTGRVYIHDNHNIFERVFVAASLPEFLTLITQESKAWFEANRWSEEDE